MKTMKLHEIKIGEQFRVGRSADGIIYTKTGPQSGGITNRHSGRIIQQYWHHCKVVTPVSEQDAMAQIEALDKEKMAK